MTSTPIGVDPTTLLAYDTGNGTVQIVNLSNPLPVGIQGNLSGNITGNVTVNEASTATAADPVYGEGTNQELSVDLSGHLRVRDANTPALGQTNAAGSLPVVIANNQTAVPVAGNLTSAGNVTAIVGALPAGTNVLGHVIVDSGTVTTVSAVTAITNALPSGANVIGHVINDSGNITVSGGNLTSGGNVTVTNTASSAVNVQDSYFFNNITTNTTTTVKSGSGILHAIVINTLGSVASAVTMYDNTSASGTKIGTINSLTISGSIDYDAAFTTGLTIVTTGSPDITVLYR